MPITPFHIIAGFAVYLWPSGAVYVGEFRNGDRHGKGTHTYPNGQVDQGIWKNNDFVGE